MPTQNERSEDSPNLSEESAAPATAAPGLSRRDFLRRAGREAAETGTRLVPGAALAKTVLGVGKSAVPEPEQTLESGDSDTGGEGRKLPRWLLALAERRQKSTRERYERNGENNVR